MEVSIVCLCNVSHVTCVEISAHVKMDDCWQGGIKGSNCVEIVGVCACISHLPQTCVCVCVLCKGFQGT
jgi:hypothetical protein